MVRPLPLPCGQPSTPLLAWSSCSLATDLTKRARAISCSDGSPERTSVALLPDSLPPRFYCLDTCPLAALPIPHFPMPFFPMPISL
jgi:hypothetical protein